MKFDEALMIFRNELIKEYGHRGEGLLKIGLDHELYNTIVLQYLNDGTTARYDYSPAGINKTMIHGIEIKVTEKDRF